MMLIRTKKHQNMFEIIPLKPVKYDKKIPNIQKIYEIDLKIQELLYTNYLVVYYFYSINY